jgi:hypothetical protein
MVVTYIYQYNLRDVDLEYMGMEGFAMKYLTPKI